MGLAAMRLDTHAAGGFCALSERRARGFGGLDRSLRGRDNSNSGSFIEQRFT
jgi:hypothetical protein